MTVAEFEEKYYLHDSSLDKFEYDAASKKLVLTISFCFWQQNWYDKSTPTNGVIAVTFDNVSQIEYEQHDIGKKFDALETEICTTKIDETGALEIVMWEFLPEIGDDIYPSLKVKAESVEVTELERFNL